MNFIDNEHKVFWEEKYKIIEKYSKVDAYYKSFIYTLGICEVTRIHFDEIFDIKNGEINIDCINYSWQTNTSSKVVRLAFSLWNSCNYDSTEDFEKKHLSKLYNISEIFSCSFAPFFVEAIKIRFPEYFKGSVLNEFIEIEEKNIDKML